VRRASMTSNLDMPEVLTIREADESELTKP